MSDINAFGMLERTGGGESKAAYIVDSSYSENSWYRVWSDGWIEQGGCIDVVQSAISNVTFMIPYTHVPNVFSERERYKGSCGYVMGVASESVTVNGFVVRADTWGTTAGRTITVKQYWRAEGY